jgi:hypothetical protein
MNLVECARLPRRPLTGTWYCAVQPQHWPTHNVAVFEVQALLGSLITPVPQPTQPWVVLNAVVQLQAMVDPTYPQEQ